MSFDTNTPAPQPPLGAPITPASAPTSSKNTLGLVALILAVVGFIIGFVPLLGIVGWPLLTAAFVIAIVALAKKRKPAWMSVVALVLSIVGPIVLGIVAAVTAANVVGAALEQSTGTSVEQPADAPADDQAAEEEAPAEEADAAEEASGPVPVGTAAQTGNLAITVTQVEAGVPQVGEEVAGTLLGEKAQGQFVLVHVSVENVGKEAETFADMNAKVYDADDREFDANSTAGFYIEGNDSLFGEINPGNTLEGVLVFDIPADAAVERMEYQGLLDFLGEPAVFGLK